MNRNYWSNAQDVEFDYVAVSDLYDSTAKSNFKPSAQQRKARARPSIYMDESTDDDFNNRNCFVPKGRGAGFLDSNFKLPVGLPSSLQRHEDITNDIREACEFRFNCDEIADSLQNSFHPPQKEESSNKSSNTSSPVKRVTTNGIASSTSLLQNGCSAANGNDVHHEERPPPLYDIIKAATRSRKKMKLVRTETKDEIEETAKITQKSKIIENHQKLDMTNMFYPVTNEYDISSEMDFPKLS